MNAREWVDEHFKGRVGRFLEIGAFDGVTDSLTAGLIDAGWEGVMIEPNPSVFLRLLVNRGDNPRLHLIHAAITPRGRLRRFWAETSKPGQTSTLNERFADGFRENHGRTYRQYSIATASVTDLFLFIGGPRGWQFVMTDTEGLDVQLLKLMPVRYMIDTEVICAEAAGGDVAKALSPFYRVAHVAEPNAIAVRNGI